MNVKLSKRLHVPLFEFQKGIDCSMFDLRKVQLYRHVAKSGLNMDKEGFLMKAEMIENGYLYKPYFSLEGKTVLDLGACCGESAELYLKWGAKEVLCVEPNPIRCSMLKANAKKFNWNVTIYPQKTLPFHFTLKADFVKCDIEGYEMDFINELQKVPSIVEVHSWWIYDQFRKHKFTNQSRINPMSGIGLVKSF